jgi:hypothetical protein
MSIAPPRPPGVSVEADWIPDDQEWELAARDLEGRRQGTVQRWGLNVSVEREDERGKSLTIRASRSAWWSASKVKQTEGRRIATKTRRFPA